MRTYQMIINPTKNKQNATLCQYFQASTAESKCMYNTANFYIHNTMTGLKKSPEERMHSEIEVMHYVFTGIQRCNDIKIKEIETLKLRSVGGLNSEIINHAGYTLQKAYTISHKREVVPVLRNTKHVT